MKRISKGRPNCAILDKRYKVFPFFFLYFPVGIRRNKKWMLRMIFMMSCLDLVTIN